MASVGKESFKQDLVVSIRYRNELPPPPMPPKFLDIDTGGITQYLTTSYASSLARREEPNIDADAEGGMPIDMIGVPGYFLGDESAIMAPDSKPILDPADQDLMVTVEQLKSQGARNNVSFLRKNQYLSSQNARTTDRLGAAIQRPVKAINKAAPQLDRNDSEYIKKHIQKGFNIAYPESIPYNPPEARAQVANDAERKAWADPRHPTNPRARPVASYPVLPDLETGTDAGLWGRVKFDKPPLAAQNGKRDDRIDSAIFMAVSNPKAEAEWQAARDAFEKEPKSYADPGLVPPYTYVMTLAQEAAHASKVRKVLFDGHPEQHDASLREEVFTESEDGTPRIPFSRSRIYPTVQQTSIAANRFMALGLYDPESAANAVPPSDSKRNQGLAAYFYPISENLRFKTDRGKVSRYQNTGDDDVVHIDRMMVAVTEPNPFQKSERTAFRGRFDDRFRDEHERLLKEADAYREEQEKAQEDVQMDDGEDEDEGVEVNGASKGEGAEARKSVEVGDEEEDAMEDD